MELCQIFFSSYQAALQETWVDEALKKAWVIPENPRVLKTAYVSTGKAIGTILASMYAYMHATGKQHGCSKPFSSSL